MKRSLDDPSDDPLVSPWPTAPGTLPYGTTAQDFLAVFEGSDNLLCIYSPVRDPVTDAWDLRFERVNDAFAQAFWGGTRVHLGRRVTEVCPDVLPESLPRMLEVLVTGRPIQQDSMVPRLNRWFETKLLRSDSGRLISIQTDITETELQRRLVKEASQRFQSLFEMGAVKFVIEAATGRILEANAQAAAYYGWSRDELLQMNIDQINTLSSSTVRTEMNKVVSGGGRFFHFRHRLRSGVIREVEVHSSYGVWNEERVLFSIVFDRSEVEFLRDSSAVSLLEGRSEGPRDGAERLFSAFLARLKGKVSGARDLVPRLLSVAKVRHLQRGDTFLKAGDPTTFFGVSNDGFFRSYLIDERGEEVTLGFSRPGQIVASHGALVTGEPSPISIEALNPCEVCLLESQRVLQIMTNEPQWFRVLYHLLEPELFVKEKREIDLLTHDARTRYRHFLEDFPDLSPLLRNYQVASYLGISPETLSRIRSSENIAKS